MSAITQLIEKIARKAIIVFMLVDEDPAGGAHDGGLHRSQSGAYRDGG